MKKGSNFLKLYNINFVIGYRGAGDTVSQSKIFLSTDIPKTNAEIQSRILNEKQSVDSQSEAVKIIITSNIIDK